MLTIHFKDKLIIGVQNQKFIPLISKILSPKKKKKTVGKKDI